MLLSRVGDVVAAVGDVTAAVAMLSVREESDALVIPYTSSRM